MSDVTYHRLLQRQIRRLVPPELNDQLASFYQSISEFYESAEIERRLLENTLDVSSKELEAANRSLREQNKTLLAQEELRRSRDNALLEMERAREANRAKDAFLSSMSHELRTPLNAIIGFSQILLAKKTTPEPVLMFVEKIHIAGKNLLSLVNTILDFSKIEAGKMECHPAKMSFNALMEEVKILIEPMAEKKGLKLLLDVEREISLNADKQLLKQVLVNLLSNAIKFSPENESIKLYHQENQDEYVLGIADHGMGISEEQIKTLFDPFVQVREHQNESIKGTGLGLAIVKRIIEMHGGRIWVKSEVGRGSCFYLSLPKQPRVIDEN